MTIYFAGTEHDAVEGGSGISTNTNYFDSNYSRLAIVNPYLVSCGQTLSTEFGANTSFWVGFSIYQVSTNNPSKQLLSIYDSNGNKSVEVYPGGGYMGLILRVYNNIDSYADAPYFNHINNLLHRYDLNVYTDNGICYSKLYRNNIQIAQTSLNGNNRGIKTLEIYNGIQNTSYISEIIIADESTLGMRVKTYWPTADGTHTTWEGNFDNVNNNDVGIEAISTQLPNAVETFLHGRTLSEGTTIRAITIGAAIASANPTDASAVLNIGGTLYQKAFEKPLTQGAAPNIAIYETNPATGVSFTAADFNSLEFGVQHA